MQSEREIRPALDYVGWEVRWPASIGSDPEAIVGGYSPYRLVVRFDTDCGKSKSVMTQRAGSQGAFTERWRGVELLHAPEGVARRLYKWDTGRRLPTDCARRRLRRGLDHGARPSSRSPRAPCCSRIPVREMERPKTTL